jgi:hypothetical protein
LIVERADPKLPHMGLTSWNGSRVRQQDVTIAKNYLTFNEKDLLSHAGKISAQIAEELSLERYFEFNQKQREEERLRADTEDMVLLEATQEKANSPELFSEK